MPLLADYELLDFGHGRKLERFGPHRVDRPAPAAPDAPAGGSALWRQAAARFERTAADRGLWHPPDALPANWTLRCGPWRMELRPTAFGHLGIFPEQADCWQWIARQVAALDPPPKVLNLFAHTGGSTLAAAAAGAGTLVHVDAARSAVAWARRNAAISSLADRPIRWIVEDAAAFVRREVRRGNRYDAVLLDPPSYGHGPKGQPWKLARDLEPLLAQCRQLLVPRPKMLLLTCHTPGYGPRELAELASVALAGVPRREIEARPLELVAADGRRLPCGALARWPA